MSVYVWWLLTCDKTAFLGDFTEWIGQTYCSHFTDKKSKARSEGALFKVTNVQRGDLAGPA